MATSFTTLRRIPKSIWALGGVSLVAIVVATVLAATWRTTRVSVPRQRRTVGRWADGLPITGRAGLALGRGAGVGSSVSRAAIVSSALGAAAVVVTATLLLSMNALRSHPERFGVAFDAHVGNSASPDGIRADFEAIDATAAIEAAGEENSFPVSIGDYTTTIGAVLDHKGHIGYPPPLSGRFPSTVDEIAVGLRTAERLGLHIGSRIEQVRSLTSQDVVLGPYTVVGIVTPMSNGDAAGDGFTAIWDEAVKLETFDRSNGIVVRFNPNMSPAEAIAAIRAAKDSADRRRFELTVQLPQPPTEILNVSNIRRTPGVLAALLAAMATAALVHSVVTTVRRQRRQLGVLRALGFTRSQVAATVGWHATLLVGAAAVIGVPVGVIAGRWAWRLITSRLYVVSAPEVPWLAFALTVVGLFAIANLVALIPGRRAARLDVAETLRTD